MASKYKATKSPQEVKTDLPYFKHQDVFATHDSTPAVGLIGLDSLLCGHWQGEATAQSAVISCKLPTHPNLSGFESVT